MEGLLIVLCVLVFFGAIFAFSPVVLTLDSCNRQVQVRWLAMLEYWRPLPGTSGESCVYFFRKPMRLWAQRPAKEPRKRAAQGQWRRRRQSAWGKFFLQCLGDSAVRSSLAQQLWKLGKGVSRSVVLARASSEISLPDPALNGMLAGAIAQSSWSRRSGIRVNFRGENSLFLEVRIHPHRAFKALLCFLLALPYRAMFRQWRALSAAQLQ